LRAFGLELTATRSAVVTYAALACVGAVAASRRWRLSTTSSVGAGLLVAALHAAAVLFHHGGHATAARCVGHPMRGVRYWGPLATSVYPSDEPPLPPTVHLTRAAGGPVASLLLALAVAASSARLRVRGGLGADLARFVVFDNLCVLSLGSLLPLGFTDGSTLLEWGRRAAVREG
jgi:hypothetical protein